MQLLPGTVVKSTDDLKQTIFENTIILIAQIDTNGTVGFVINKSFTRSLNELAEFSTSRSFPLYAGGPVNPEHLFFIHKRPDLIEGGSVIEQPVYMGGDFNNAVLCINTNTITTKDLKLFIGYCGWDAGELEAEIDEGSWEIVHDGIRNKGVFE